MFFILIVTTKRATMLAVVKMADTMAAKEKRRGRIQSAKRALVTEWLSRVSINHIGIY